MDRYNCAERWKTKVSIQFGHFFLSGYKSVSCNKGSCLRGSKRPHAPPQTPTRQTIVKTNVVQIQAHTHDNTEEENVWCSCVGWILNKHILSFPASNQHVAVLMSSSLDELIQGHKKKNKNVAVRKLMNYELSTCCWHVWCLFF